MGEQVYRGEKYDSDSEKVVFEVSMGHQTEKVSLEGEGKSNYNFCQVLTQ